MTPFFFRNTKRRRYRSGHPRTQSGVRYWLLSNFYFWRKWCTKGLLNCLFLFPTFIQLTLFNKTSYWKSSAYIRCSHLLLRSEFFKNIWRITASSSLMNTKFSCLKKQMAAEFLKNFDDIFSAYSTNYLRNYLRIIEEFF